MSQPLLSPFEPDAPNPPRPLLVAERFQPFDRPLQPFLVLSLLMPLALARQWPAPPLWRPSHFDICYPPPFSTDERISSQTLTLDFDSNQMCRPDCLHRFFWLRPRESRLRFV